MPDKDNSTDTGSLGENEKNADEGTSRRLTMEERWALDDERPMQVWFNSLDELQSAITGYNSYGVPIFKEGAGIPADLTDDLVQKAKGHLSQGKNPAQALQELLKDSKVRGHQATAAIKEAQESLGTKNGQ